MRAGGTHRVATRGGFLDGDFPDWASCQVRVIPRNGAVNEAYAYFRRTPAKLHQGYKPDEFQRNAAAPVVGSRHGGSVSKPVTLQAFISDHQTLRFCRRGLRSPFRIGASLRRSLILGWRPPCFNSHKHAMGKSRLDGRREAKPEQTSCNRSHRLRGLVIDRRRGPSCIPPDRRAQDEAPPSGHQYRCDASKSGRWATTSLCDYPRAHFLYRVILTQSED